MTRNELFTHQLRSFVRRSLQFFPQLPNFLFEDLLFLALPMVLGEQLFEGEQSAVVRLARQEIDVTIEENISDAPVIHVGLEELFSVHGDSI